MNRSIIAKTFAIAAVVALVVAIAPTAKAAEKGCTNASLTGTFAFRGTGSHVPPDGLLHLLDVVFVQTFDGNGVLTATGSKAITAR